MKFPVNLKTVVSADNLPDGRYRMRIVKPTIYPKDQEIDESGAVVGQTWDDGNQKYGQLRLGLRFIEHPSNYVPGADGKVQSLVGQTRFDSVNLDRYRMLNELYAAVGVDTDAEVEALGEQEVDVVYKTYKKRDGTEATGLQGFRKPVG